MSAPLTAAAAREALAALDPTPSTIGSVRDALDILGSVADAVVAARRLALDVEAARDIARDWLADADRLDALAPVLAAIVEAPTLADAVTLRAILAERRRDAIREAATLDDVEARQRAAADSARERVGRALSAALGAQS